MDDEVTTEQYSCQVQTRLPGLLKTWFWQWEIAVASCCMLQSQHHKILTDTRTTLDVVSLVQDDTLELGLEPARVQWRVRCS